MKLLKLSLIAAIAATTAIAGEAKVSGDAKLFYGTNDAGTSSLFSKGASQGDAAVSLDYSKEVADGVTVNVGATGITTLGLENELVSSTWVNHRSGVAGTAGVKDTGWIDTANIVLNLGKTTAVIGRQELDTPFFRSEKWNIAANTFDAAVLVNQDIEDTTLVGAWVGRGNGTAFGSGAAGGGTVNAVDNQAGMSGFPGSGPAYAVGVITKAIPMTTLQLWGYKLPTLATAQWVQADITATDEVSVGLQYAGTKLTRTGAKTSAVAAKVGYSSGPLAVSGAYSSRDDKAGIDISNIATGHRIGGSESNLYTEGYWNYGYVGAQGAKAFKLHGSYDLGAAQISAGYLKSDATLDAHDLAEASLVASTKVGPLNAEIALINQKINTDSSNSILVMLTAPFSL